MCSGGDQGLHSPTAWLPQGYEPGADGAALLPSSKKGALRALGISDRRHDPMVAADRRGGSAAGAQTHTRAITAHTDQSPRVRRTRSARHDHGMHGAVTAHTPRSQHVGCSHGARGGHGVRASATAGALRSLSALPSQHARLDRAARAAQRKAKRPQAGQRGSLGRLKHGVWSRPWRTRPRSRKRAIRVV